MRQRSEMFIEALGRLRPVDRQIIVWRIELGYSDANSPAAGQVDRVGPHEREPGH